MIKKYLPLLLLIVSFSFFTTQVNGQEEEIDLTKSEQIIDNIDYNIINPTVQIFSAKRSPNGQVNAVGSGSGTIFDGRTILTNHHVVNDGFEGKVLDAFYVGVATDFEKKPKTYLTAKLIAYNEDLDLAMLRVDEEDIFGNPVPELPYLEPAYDIELKEGDQITAVGFPDIGAGTATTTSGNFSGYIESNGARYVKMDTVISFGNSGGTALFEGSFVGVPTFGISSGLNSLGYFLDIKEAQEWIESNVNKEPTENPEAEMVLKDKLLNFVIANLEKKVIYNEHPGLEMSIPDDWEFGYIGKDGIWAQKPNASERWEIDVLLQKYPYSLTQEYIADLHTRLDTIKDQAPDYKRQEITFNGYEAFKVSYSSFGEEQTLIYVDRGYVMVVISYSLNVDKKDEQMEVYQTILDSITLHDRSTTPDSVSQISFQNPDFSLNLPNGWAMIPGLTGTTMLEADQENNSFGMLSVSYDMIYPSDRNLSNKERMNLETEYLGEYGSLIYKKDDVKIDGLEGFLYVYEYEDPYYPSEKRKSLNLRLRNGNYEYVFYYDDRTNQFDANTQEIIDILSSFTFEGDRASKGVYDIGTFQSRFTDTKDHIFENSINTLAEKGILQGFPDGSYRPEANLTRAELLTGTLKAFQILQEEKGREENRINFSLYEKDSAFSDSKKEDWFNRYVVYANENDYIEGYEEDGTFRPHELAAVAHGVKMVLEINNVDVWEGETAPWYQRYWDAAYKKDFLHPRIASVESFEKPMTRGEFADLLLKVYDYSL